MDEKSKDIILGAGMAGLGAWYADREMEMYEADSQAGGLCGAIEIKGFHFDKAVHLSFSDIDLVKDLFSKTEQYIHHPVPKSWYHTLWLKHPAQNNLFPLPAEEKVKAVAGFLERDQTLDESNFKGWNRSRYGEYLWKHFFEPYNQKYWDIDLSVLGADWIGNRIYQPALEEILYGSYTDQTPNTYYAPEMRYPRKGGYYSYIKEIVEKAEKQRKIHYFSKAVRIDTQRKTVFFENGKRCSYKKLYSSVPLPQLIRMMDSIPGEWKDSARLDYTRVALVSMGLKKCSLKQMWFYIYDLDIMAARAYMPSVKAASNVPEGCDSIQFEVYCNSKNEIPGEHKCVSNCIYALEKLGICKEKDVLFADYRILPYGNVILKNGDRTYVESVIKWMKSRDIYPVGRFGCWEYLWSDQSFMSGYRTVASKVE